MPADFGLTLFAVFITVALVTASTASLVLTRMSPERRQLRKLGRPAAAAVLLPVSLTDAPSRFQQRLDRVLPKSPKEMSRLRRRLAAGGYHAGTAVALYSAAELALPLAFGLAMVAVRGVSDGGWLFAVIAAGGGYVIPSFWLGRKTTQRQKQIQNGLPDALDLLIVCIEAGSSIDQALMKSSDELAISYPALAEELHMVLTETRAGKSRVEAFKNFASRTKVDDVRALSAMLIQTDRFGTSIAQALRTHAETSRTKRRQRAEEKAGKIGVKLVFPLVFCLFPALYVVILGPAVVEYVRVFKGQILR
jgi:tight adherence protein C